MIVRVVKWALVITFITVLLLASFYFYLSQTRDLRGAVRDDWRPPSAPAVALAPAPRQPCSNSSPTKVAFFGDLHTLSLIHI